MYDTKLNDNTSFKQSHRERSLQILMRVNLLKRLESSVDSFRITLSKFIKECGQTIATIDKFEQNGAQAFTLATEIDEVNLDAESDDWLNDEFSIGDKIKINLADMNIPVGKLIWSLIFILEGQNLQDCDTLINYDIHWNPVRIIQRYRIGSINNDIHSPSLQA